MVSTECLSRWFPSPSSQHTPSAVCQYVGGRISCGANDEQAMNSTAIEMRWGREMNCEMRVPRVRDSHASMVQGWCYVGFAMPHPHATLPHLHCQTCSRIHPSPYFILSHASWLLVKQGHMMTCNRQNAKSAWEEHQPLHTFKLSMSYMVLCCHFFFRLPNLWSWVMRPCGNGWTI